MTDVPAAPAADANSLATAVASLAAVATSLNEVSTKLSSVTENISKVAEGIAGQSSTADSARSIDNVFNVGNVEGIRADLVDFGRRSRQWFDKMAGDILSHDNDVRAILTRAMVNSTETDNMVGKQAVRHLDTQLFETATTEGATTNVAQGEVVNVLLAAVDSLKAVAAALATPAPATPASAKA